MNGTRPWAGRRLHFVGVGGAGMSGYARAAHALGAEVSGSDRAHTPFLERLHSAGVLRASIGHHADNLPAGGDVEVIHSSAIAPDNPERVAAADRGLPDRPRADLLGELTLLRRTVAIGGAHGKTTTSSMIVHVLAAAGLDPGWLVGASIGDGADNGHWSDGEWLVVEADESDRSMLSLNMEVAVLTNVELDHHAAFGSERELRDDFREFLSHASQAVIWDRPDLLELRDGPVVPYDVGECSLGPDGSSFRWRELDVTLAVPGAHNALNAVAALEVALLAGVDATAAAASLADFHGAGRRFQTLGYTASGARVVDDYAHHPTEVAATLRAARTLRPVRLIAAFQPHLYSRTAHLAREFGQALALADRAVVLDVYPARERAEDFPGVSGLLVAGAVADAAPGREVMWLPRVDDAEQVLRERLRDGDLLVVMGAGDVDELGRRLVVA